MEGCERRGREGGKEGVVNQKGREEGREGRREGGVRRGSLPLRHNARLPWPGWR